MYFPCSLTYLILINHFYSNQNIICLNFYYAESDGYDVYDDHNGYVDYYNDLDLFLYNLDYRFDNIANFAFVIYKEVSISFPDNVSIL